jgi:hypothetical protein
MSSENKNRRSQSLRSQGHSHSLRSKQSEEGVASGAGGPVSTVRSEDFLERHRLGSSMDAEDARSFYAVVSCIESLLGNNYFNSVISLSPAVGTGTDTQTNSMLSISLSTSPPLHLSTLLHISPSQTRMHKHQIGISYQSLVLPLRLCLPAVDPRFKGTDSPYIPQTVARKGVWNRSSD